MVSRTERYQAKAAECEAAAKSTAIHALKAMYLDLACQWRQLAHQVETLDRERSCSPSRDIRMG
jgi:hypothetical protein